MALGLDAGVGLIDDSPDVAESTATARPGMLDVALSRDRGPTDGRYTLAGNSVETGEGPVVDGGW